MLQLWSVWGGLLAEQGIPSERGKCWLKSGTLESHLWDGEFRKGENMLLIMMEWTGVSGDT